MRAPLVRDPVAFRARLRERVRQVMNFYNAGYSIEDACEIARELDVNVIVISLGPGGGDRPTLTE